MTLLKILRYPSFSEPDLKKSKAEKRNTRPLITRTIPS